MEICSKCTSLLSRKASLFCNLRILPIRLFNSELVKNETKAAEIKWEPVIGLEIHAQINTKSKLFSSAKNEFMAPPNSLVSEFDAALPGTLPVLNKSCAEAAVLTSLALDCQVNHKSYFDRKHYFYSDLPQGYQITQYWKPIAENGRMCIPTSTGCENSEVTWKEIGIERIQLEQDSGKSLHDANAKLSLIDLNRAGVGLMEIVTAPDFRSAEEAATFVSDLKLTMQNLGTCKGKIADGNLRVDANISIHEPGEPFGVRSEVKNIAGIAALVDAINYEISRQKSVLNGGGKVVNETREYDSEKGVTVSMRDKEEFQDYRFMPEPNLPPLILYHNGNLPSTFDSKKQINVDDIREKVCNYQHPSVLRRRLIENHNLTIEQSSFLLGRHLGKFYLDTLDIAPHLSPALLFDWTTIELLGYIYKLNIRVEDSLIKPKQIAELLSLLQENKVNRAYATKIFEVLTTAGGSPTEAPQISKPTFHLHVIAEVSAVSSLKNAGVSHWAHYVRIMEANEWTLISDISDIKKLCRQAIKSQDKEKLFKKYRRGEHHRPKNRKAVSHIVNIVMKLSGEKAHTKVTQTVAKNMLDDYFMKFTSKKI